MVIQDGPEAGRVQQLAVSQDERLRSLLTPAIFQEAIDHLAQGLVCFDARQQLVCHNRQYLALLDLPEELLARHPTKQDIVAFQRARGDFDPPSRFFDERGLTVHPNPDTDEMPDHYWREVRSGRVLEVRVSWLSSGIQVRSFSDVTPYLLTRREAQQNAARLQRVIDALDPGTWEVNLNTSAVEINAAWAGIVGYPLDELQPMTRERWRGMVHPDDVVQNNVAAIAFMTGTVRQFDSTFRMRHRQGHWVWVRCTGKNYQGVLDDGSIVISGTLIDVTDKITAQERSEQSVNRLQAEVQAQNLLLERAVQDIAMVSSSLAHDLRTPLRSINGYASMLCEPVLALDPAQVAAYTERIRELSARMGRMITSMLDLLRIMQVQPRVRPLKVSDLAHEAMKALQAENTSPFEFVCDDTPVVTTDPALLKAALRQLLSNAINFSAPGQVAQVGLSYAPQEDVYLIRDQGVGFDMTKAHQLFKPFNQINRSSQDSGLGMGLAIASQIIERLGGRLWASSAPGEGATFYFSLGERQSAPDRPSQA